MAELSVDARFIIAQIAFLGFLISCGGLGCVLFCELAVALGFAYRKGDRDEDDSDLD